MRAMSWVTAMMAGLCCGPALAGSDAVIERQGPDLWRASKLVGVDVFGPDGRKVGDVSEVLLDHDGRAAAVVIGVGGFLGIGRKDVALPYGALHLTGEPRAGVQQTGAAAPGDAAGMPTEPGLTAGSAIPVETAAAQREPPAGATTAPAALGGPVGTTSGVAGGTVTGQALDAGAPRAGWPGRAPEHGASRPRDDRPHGRPAEGGAGLCLRALTRAVPVPVGQAPGVAAAAAARCHSTA